MPERKSFKITVQEFEFDLEDGNGQMIPCKLKEMTGKERDQYMNKIKNRTILNPDGKSGRIKDYNGMFSDLLVMCLYRNGEKMDEKEIQALPASTQSELFDEAQKLSRLNLSEEDIDKLKKN